MGDSWATSWLKDAFEKAYDEEGAKIGRFNLAIFGKTGVGKSTLVNAIFGEDIAETGIGEPVTRGEHLYLHQSGSLGVLDTQGLEVGVDSETILSELNEYLTQMRRGELADQLHVAWYCVRAGDRRFEDTEADFIRALHQLGLPVMLVLTQVPRHDGIYHPDAEALATDIIARKLPVADNTVYRTLAMPDEVSKLEAHGLRELLDATFRVAPEGVRNAINAAQQIDFSRKREAAKAAVQLAAGSAAAAGASPIPFSDAAILVPIQLTMMARISHLYGLKIDRAATAAIGATAAATATGRSLVTNMIKFVPVAGSVVGGGISATVAFSMTYAMGMAWQVVCERIATGELSGIGDALDSQAIRDLFMREFKAQAKKRMPGSDK